MKHRLPFEILYEDRDVIVIDKPAGLLTTHTRAKESNTAEELLNDYVRKGQRKSRNHVWLVHRLDRETSGVMMFAKSEEVGEYFRSDWNALTEKIYIARVAGEFAEDHGVFESYLQEDADGYKVHSVPPPNLPNPRNSRNPRNPHNPHNPHNPRNPHNPLNPLNPHNLRNPPKLARTEWRRLSVEDGTTLVEVSLKSGRKNQIRVHFSEAGHPVIGDEKYGGERASRLYLHAFRLKFRHPHTGKWLVLESPCPFVL